jgi:hypothetical protein
MADVLTDDLGAAARSLVRSLVDLPAEAATHFRLIAETQHRELLEQIRPEAQADASTYVSTELERLTGELDRLRQVARVKTVRRRGVVARQGPSADDLDELLKGIDAKLKAARARLARTPARPARARGRRQRAVEEQAARFVLRMQNALEEVLAARRELDDDRRGGVSPRATRGSRRRTHVRRG